MLQERSVLMIVVLIFSQAVLPAFVPALEVRRRRGD